MAEKTKLTGIEINGTSYGLGKTIYEEIGISLERFTEILGRDLYCPTLASAPGTSTLTYTDTNGEDQTFQVGQPCRWVEGGQYRLAVCKDITGTGSAWYVLPQKVSELTNDSGYLTEHQDISGKQDTISDLATIRANASKGATALQEVPAEYITETELTAKGYATTAAMNTALGDKVDKVSGKGLSTNDFTSALKTKLEDLNNYDDTELSNAVSTLQSRLDTLVSGDASTAIDSFNEIIAFLDGIEDSQDLESIVASIEQQIASKQASISDLDTIRAGAAKGATALQSYTETDPVFSASAAAGIKASDITNWNSKTSNTGTITGIKMNGASKGTSGVVDLGTVITAHQDISGKQDKVLKFENLTASNWVSDSTYADFPKRCDITCTGVTETMFGEVVFGITEATSGNYAPLCRTGTNVVSIYSNVTTSITVPTIIVTK